MASPDGIDQRLSVIEQRLDQIHTALLGDIHGKTGLLNRFTELDQRVQRLEAAQGWVRGLVGGAVAAIVSAWAMVWGGPHK
jgi:hypothetical protein